VIVHLHQLQQHRPMPRPRLIHSYIRRR